MPFIQTWVSLFNHDTVSRIETLIALFPILCNKVLLEEDGQPLGLRGAKTKDASAVQEDI